MSTICDIAMTTDGDIDLSDGKALAWIADEDAIAQRVAIRLRMFRGEWYLDADLGVDYAGRVLGVTDASRAEAEIKRAILGVPGIAELSSFTLTLDGGAASVVWSALTDTGALVGSSLTIGA